MVFGLFTPRKVTGFAKSLAQNVARRYPPAIANNPDQIVSQKRIAEILDEAFTGAQRFAEEHRLGLLSRLGLRSTFKQEMREIGYEEKFAVFAVDFLTGHLTRNSR
jgi:hypothetical protein